MKNENEILARLKETKSDERLTYKTADVFSNAPLALIQLNMEVLINTLEWVLELPPSTFPLPKKGKSHGKEMELGKDFELRHNTHWTNDETIAIPITQRTYSEQDLLDVWEACFDFLRNPFDYRNKQQFFKQKFGIEIK